MTVTSLREEMSWNELKSWIQFFDLNPHEYDTHHRGEFMMAQIAAISANAYISEPVCPEDLMIKVQKESLPDYNDLKVFFIKNGIEGQEGVLH